MKNDWFSPKIIFNWVLAGTLALALVLDFLGILPFGKGVFIFLSFLGILPVIWSAIQALFKKELSVDLLASIALLFSFLAKDWHSATFILLMITSARIFDLWTEHKAQKIIEHLLKYRPEKVKVKVGERLVETLIEHLKKGDLVVIESGERIPVDGTIVSGMASVDESTLTGESEPIAKKIGDNVFSSTLAINGSLLVRSEKVGEDSTLARISNLIGEASRKKAKTEKFVAKFTAWYIVAVLVGAVIIYAISKDIYLVLAVMLVVCADDLAVAVPLAYSAAIVRGAQKGIILKGSDVLEKLPKIKIFMTDKTGTLTYGKPKIEELVPASDISEKKLLELLAIAEVNSNHPMAIAIENYAKDRHVVSGAPDEFHETPGEGIFIKHNKAKIFAGKIDYLLMNKIKITAEEKREMQGKKEEGASITAIGADGKFLGFVVAEDKIRPFARDLVAATKKIGVRKWVMLTGDNERVAQRVAGGLGIKHYVANMRPESKLLEIEKVKAKERGILAMIGDGVNDAAALAMADVSFAMGAIGSDTAIEAADVALMKDNLKRIPQAMLLGRMTQKIVWQNFGLWAITNAAGLFLVFTGVLHPTGAATFNFLTDFLPIANALRVKVPKLDLPAAETNIK